MYKKILVLVIGISFILRAIPMSIYFISGRATLPMAVLAFSGIMVAFAAYLIIKLFVKGLDLKEITAYYALDFISVLFNIIYAVFYASVGKTDIIDTLIVGNVFVLLLNPALVYFAFKKDKYISIPSKMVQPSSEEKVAEQPAEQAAVIAENTSELEHEEEVKEETKVQEKQQNKQPNSNHSQKKKNHKKGKKSKK